MAADLLNDEKIGLSKTKEYPPSVEFRSGQRVEFMLPLGGLDHAFHEGICDGGFGSAICDELGVV